MDTEIEKGTTNVYADLGRPDADAMLVKAQLAAKIGEIIKRRNSRRWRRQRSSTCRNPSCPACCAGSSPGDQRSQDAQLPHPPRP